MSELIVGYPVFGPDPYKCVYKILFPDDYFYVGSTSNLKKRIGGYRSAYKNSIGNVNKLLASKMIEHGCCYFEVLEMIPEWFDPYEVEDRWLKKFFSSPLILNRSSSAYNNTGAYKSQLNRLK